MNTQISVKLEVHKVLTARQILGDYEKYASYFRENGEGIYFHIYDNSDIPFYIGISENMLRRNHDHLTAYRYGQYWLPKNPDGLKGAQCYINYKDADAHKFYSPNRPDDMDGHEGAVAKLFDNMSIMFSRVYNISENIPANRYQIEVVERQLQQNQIDILKVHKSWNGRLGSNKGGGLGTDEYAIEIAYTENIPNDVNRLKLDALIPTCS